MPENNTQKVLKNWGKPKKTKSSLKQKEEELQFNDIEGLEAQYPRLQSYYAKGNGISKPHPLTKLSGTVGALGLISDIAEMSNSKKEDLADWQLKGIGLEPGLPDPKQVYYNGGYMKKYKKRLGVGGTTEPVMSSQTANGIYGGIDAVGSAVGVPMLGQAVKLNDKFMDFAGDAVRNIKSKNRNLSEEEQNIIFAGDKKFDNIPLVGEQLGMVSDTWNALSGKTKNRLQEYNQQKDINNTMRNSGYAGNSKVTFAMGGNLDEVEGPSHEQGGVAIDSNNEVEGKETIFNNDYVFSDRLRVPGKKKTFAQLSKSIKKKYTDVRPTDPISQKEEHQALSTLADMQETLRADIIGSAHEFAYGGKIHIKPENRGKFTAYKKRTGKTTEEALHSDNPHVRQMANFARNAAKWKHAYGGDFIPRDVMDIIPSEYLSRKRTSLIPNEPSFNINGKIQPLQSQVYDPLTDNREPQVYNPNYNPNKDIMSGDFTAEQNKLLFNNQNQNTTYIPNIKTSNQTDSPYPFVIPELNTHADVQNFTKKDPVTGKIQEVKNDNSNNLGAADWMDYASMGAGVLSSALDFYQNRKIDPVNYKRYNPKAVNMTAAKILARQQGNKALNSAEYDIKQNSPSGANYNANRIALGVKGAQSLAENEANINMQEELSNNQIFNNAKQVNTNIANKEIEDYAANKGQVLTNRSQAAQNLYGNLAGSVSTYKKYKNQKLLMENMGTENVVWNPKTKKWEYKFD